MPLDMQKHKYHSKLHVKAYDLKKILDEHTQGSPQTMERWRSATILIILAALKRVRVMSECQSKDSD